MKHVSKKEARSFLSPPDGPWIPLSGEMLDSPAWRALSRAGHQMIARLSVENTRHAGRENGRLAVSWDAFQAAGIHRGQIKPTIKEVTSLGFVRCTDRGRKGFGAAIGKRATYRLTFVGVVGSSDSGPATDDWREVLSDEVAKALVVQSKVKRRARVVGAATEDIERGTQTRTGPKVRLSALGSAKA